MPAMLSKFPFVFATMPGFIHKFILKLKLWLGFVSMNLSHMISRLYVFFILLIFLTTIPLTYAQHHGGVQAPPISFGSGEVTVTTSLIPPDFIPDSQSPVNLKIRFFDTLSNINIESVSYRVQIFYGTQLVANQMFFDKDGELDIKIQPKSGCEQEDLWKCTKYFGDKDPIVPNALTSSPSSIPVISGPVFVQSGQYTIKTDIIGAKNPKTQTSQDIHFETVVAIPNVQQFMITASGTEYAISAKNFQDPLTELHYDESSHSINFQIPFNWEHVEHNAYLKNYFEIPKNFIPFNNVDSFFGKVNDVLILPKDIHYDKYSNKDFDVIHFMINNEELKNLKNAESEIKVIITPESQPSIVTNEILFDNGFKALASYDSRSSQSNDFLFSIMFFDPQGNLANDVRYVYGITDPTGKEITNTGGNPNLLGINLPNGIDTRIIDAPSEGKYSMQLGLIGLGGVDYERYLFKEFEFEIIKSITSNTTVTSKSPIPQWIKNNAGWWADGSIDDNSFIQGIQFLIKGGIMKIPTTSQGINTGSNEIPSWIKNNAGWWADGSIDDNSFINGIEFLVKKGIIIP
ncbi:MAG: hypothetical protein HW410_1499 [Nitrosarchaeum sp.]|nr:hypothetical protein [Nitrosarchaeum sp.]